MITGVLAALLGFASSEPPVSEPQLTCDIQLDRWCIAGFDGRISMTDDGRYRTWILLDRLYMADRPMYIVEDRKCTGAGSSEAPREIGRREVKDARGNSFLAVSFLLSQRENCKLEFRLPRGSDMQNRAYMRTMLYGILVCTKGACGQQLYMYAKRKPG